MNPFLNDILGAVIRTLAAGLVGWLVNHQLLSNDQAEAWVTGITGGALVLLWSIWQKYRSRRKLLTAMASDAGATEHEIEQVVQDGGSPPVTVQKDVAPFLSSKVQ
jgi:hypothetical protein